MLSLTIGRNISGTDEPMHIDAWCAFIGEARDLIRGKTPPLTRLGRAVWDGNAEDTAQLLDPHGQPPTMDFLSDVRWLAIKYKQQAIAVLFGKQDRAHCLLVHAAGHITIGDPLAAVVTPL